MVIPMASGIEVRVGQARIIAELQPITEADGPGPPKPPQSLADASMTRRRPRPVVAAKPALGRALQPTGLMRRERRRFVDGPAPGKHGADDRPTEPAAKIEKAKLGREGSACGHGHFRQMKSMGGTAKLAKTGSTTRRNDGEKSAPWRAVGGPAPRREEGRIEAVDFRLIQRLFLMAS